MESQEFVQCPVCHGKQGEFVVLSPVMTRWDGCRECQGTGRISKAALEWAAKVEKETKKKLT